MQSLRRVWEKLTVHVKYTFMHLGWPIHGLMATFGLSGMNSKYNMEMKILSETCFKIKRTVTARHRQTHVMLPEYLMQKPTVDEAMDQLKKAGVPEDEMAALERHLAPAPPKDFDKPTMKVFVGGGVQVTEIAPGKLPQTEDIDLPEEDESDEDDGKVEDDGKIEITQKEVPDAVFGAEMIKKRDREAAEKKKEKENGDGLGALERFKRIRS